MSSKNEYINILGAYNITGEFAEVLADLFAHYSDNYIADIASQYYNSSTLKAVNIDAILQLALDHGYSVFRGYNPMLTLSLYATENRMYMQPLQEIYSYGNSFFYFGNELPAIYDFGVERAVETKIIFTRIGKRVIRTENVNSEMYIIDDENPISEHVAFFIEYQQSNNTVIEFVKHTNKPFLYWSFINDNTIISNNQNERLENLYDILVMTTPRWGLYIRISDKLLNKIKSMQATLRIEYVNYNTFGELDDNSVINRLYQYIIDHYKLGIVEPASGSLSAHVPRANVETIRRRIQEGAKFNGIIRSVTDIQTAIYEAIKGYVLDIETFFVRDNNGNIKYYIIYINHPNYSISQVEQLFNDIIFTHFASNLPAVTINNNSLSSSFQAYYATPITLRVEYKYTGNKTSVVIRNFTDYMFGFRRKIIKKIKPLEWQTFLSKMSFISSLDVFDVYIDGNIVYSMNNTVLDTELTLIDIEGFRNEILNGNIPNESNYFKYIENIEIYEI
jgi:hypothetical protein